MKFTADAKQIRILTAVLILVGLIGCDAANDSPKAESGSVPEDSATEETDNVRDKGDGVTSLPSISDTKPKTAASAQPPTVQQTISFVRRSETMNLSHTYDTGAKGQLLMVESTGAGLGWLDFDRDQIMDLFCVQGGDPTLEDPSSNPSDQLFRQIDGKLVPVTELAGILDPFFSQGVTTGDFDNDGFSDLYITNVGDNRFYRNNGDGTFQPVSDTPCTATRMWSTSAAWGDLDLDGDLDLYVCNYLRYDPLDPFPCEKDGKPAMCHPFQLEHWPDEYFENLGDGTFRSCAKEKGLFGDGNKALGVVIADLSGDGWPDIYVANDTTANFYFLNMQDGTFEESSAKLGGALNAAGAMQASMGVAAGDYDRSGTTDLLLTHFSGEANTLYQNLNDVGLFDVTGRTGLLPVSDPKLGFGTLMADFDANGFMDLVIANGHIDSTNADGDGFMQKAQLLTYDGRRWHDLFDKPGDYFSQEHVGRGLALADYDNDGDPDLAIGHQNEPAEILENTSTRGNWLKVIPIPTSSNRSAIGVTAQLEVGGEKWFTSIYGGTSFCASHEPSLFFGTGTATGPSTLTVTWPDGGESVVKDVQMNRILTIREPK